MIALLLNTRLDTSLVFSQHDLTACISVEIRHCPYEIAGVAAIKI